MQKIHFVQRVASDNIGDWWCSPINYYYDFFNKYSILVHDIDSINWLEIAKDDVVILGASGMLYVTESFNSNINRLLNTCDTVIAWSIGFNTHKERPINTPVELDKFTMLSIRDYNHESGIEYLPCITCKLPQLNKKETIQRRIGVIEHKDFRIDDFKDYQSISNSCNFDLLTSFIASTEIIVANSYHAIYWALLMGKKVVCPNAFSTKFDYYQYEPTFYSGDIELDIRAAKQYPCFLEEAISLNESYFRRVKAIVEDKIQVPNSSYTHLFLMKKAAGMGHTFDYKMFLQKEQLREEFACFKGEVNKLAIQLHELENQYNDVCNRLSNVQTEIKDLHARMDTETREIHTRIDAESKEINSRMDTESRELHSRVDTSTKELHLRMDSETKELSSKIDSLQNEINESYTQLDSLRSKSSESHNQLDSLLSESSELYSRINGFQTQNKALQVKVDELCVETEAIKNSVTVRNLVRRFLAAPKNLFISWWKKA